MNNLLAMTEEQDPPSFKAARRKDRERLAELDQDENLEKVSVVFYLIFERLFLHQVLRRNVLRAFLLPIKLYK